MAILCSGEIERWPCSWCLPATLRPSALAEVYPERLPCRQSKGRSTRVGWKGETRFRCLRVFAPSREIKAACFTRRREGAKKLGGGSRHLPLRDLCVSARTPLF